MALYKVIKRWAISYPAPINLRAGDRIKIDLAKKEENPEWQGWVWCLSKDGAGWVPLQLLKTDKNLRDNTTAIVLQDYSARELALTPGEILTSEKVLNGWLWASKDTSDSTGWVPLECVELIK
jgi:hypothetical protein